MDLLFATVKFDKTIDKEKATNEIMQVEDKRWFWDPYRNTRMLPLMTRGGKPGIRGATSYSPLEDFEWTQSAPATIREWFDDVVFPWMGRKTRIMALLTKPNFSNIEHVDCDEDKVGARQHKFRVVLQGKTNTLYWITKEGNIHAPDVDEPFLMDGGWPHGMTNDSSEFKLTIAAGEPWFGNESYDNITMLQRRSEFTIPDDVTKYFMSEDLKNLMRVNGIGKG